MKLFISINSFFDLSSTKALRSFFVLPGFGIPFFAGLYLTVFALLCLLIFSQATRLVPVRHAGDAEKARIVLSSLVFVYCFYFGKNYEEELGP